MILFCDTSALIKLLISEPGSDPSLGSVHDRRISQRPMNSTSAPATSNEPDPLDQLGAKACDGSWVGEDLVRNVSRQELVPTDVVESLLGRYRASTDPADIKEGLQNAGKQLQCRCLDSSSLAR